MIPIAPMMAATTTVLLASQRKNREYEEEQKKKAQQEKEKEKEKEQKEEIIEDTSERELLPKIVKEIKVTYTDGTSRILKSGLALDVLNEEELQVDETNLKDEDILKFLDVLISYAKEKDLI